MENRTEKNKLPNLWAMYDVFAKKWHVGEHPSEPIHFKGEYPALYISAERVDQLIRQMELGEFGGGWLAGQLEELMSSEK